MDSSHERKDFVCAVLEGITFSLNESIEIFRESGEHIDTIVSTGGGTKNEDWLQMQAAYGCGWFESLQDCADQFLTVDEKFIPKEKVSRKAFKLLSHSSLDTVKK